MVLAVRGQTPARADKATAHSYYYKGQLVTLDASLDRVALVARKGARVAGADDEKALQSAGRGA